MSPVKLKHLFLRSGTYYYVRRSGGRVVWKRLSRDLSEAHWHDLRATSLTLAKEAAGIDYAQTLAGHASARQTESYIAQRSVTKVRPIH